ncbi:MAG TPA: response regulator transcription factor [Acidimicrobiales bacterium]|jgi:two-component system response regulator NreC
MKALTVVFVDDDPFAIDALEAWLDPVEGIQLHAVWGKTSEIVAACETHQPDAVLIDLILPPDGPDGIELALVLREANPDTVAIIVTSSESSEDANRAWRAGIPGYITKQMLVRHLDRLPELVRCVLDGCVIYQIDPRSAVSHMAPSVLSDRELEVLRRKADGHKHRDIADELSLGIRTIDSHLANARMKLGAATVNEALQVARRQGLLA